MDKVDQSLIAIFKADESTPEVMQSMWDIASLSGVLGDLTSQNTFQ